MHRHLKTYHYDSFLKTLKYKFTNKKNEISDLIKVKKKKFEFFIDCGNPPPNNFAKYYQAGCLAFELISNKQKIICNSGYGKYLSPKLTALSRSTAAHNGYEKKFGYVHKRSVKILKNEDKIFGVDELKKTKEYSNSLFYFIRFHIYPGIKIVKTKAGNSILISLSNGEGWKLESKTNEFQIERNIFFGNKSKIINNESVSISGNIKKDIISIEWLIEKMN